MKSGLLNASMQSHITVFSRLKECLISPTDSTYSLVFLSSMPHWLIPSKYAVDISYSKQIVTDLSKECLNFFSRVNSCSNFFLCQFPEKVSQKAVFLCKKSCQNSSRNSGVLFIYFRCRIINNSQPTMNTCFLQNTFIGEKDRYLMYHFTAELFPFHWSLFTLAHSILHCRGLSMWMVLNVYPLTWLENSPFSNSDHFTSLYNKSFIM